MTSRSQTRPKLNCKLIVELDMMQQWYAHATIVALSSYLYFSFFIWDEKDKDENHMCTKWQPFFATFAYSISRSGGSVTKDHVGAN